MSEEFKLTNQFPDELTGPAQMMEKVFSEVTSLKNPEKLKQVMKNLQHTLLLPNQMMYLICYNPKGIFLARNTERFLPYRDDELTIERIIAHISSLDADFVAKAIKAIYDWFRINKLPDLDVIFAIEHRMIDKNKETLFVQRNTRILDVDENLLPAMAVSIITNMSAIVKCDFTPRASLFNSRTGEQYFYIEAVNNVHTWISKREQEVLELLCNGLSSKQIAEKLFISKHTVDGHRRMLLEKTKISSTPELVSYAHKNKWVK